MSDRYPDLRQEIEALTTPSDAEIQEAKIVVLGGLADGKAHWTSELIGQVLEASGLSRDETPLHVDVRSESDASNLALDDPTVANVRVREAATEALADLQAAGIVVPAVLDGNPSDGIRLPSSIHVGFQAEGMRSGVTLAPGLPTLSPAFRLPHALRDTELPRWLDHRLWEEDLAALGLDRRTERTLSEALRAYRRGLYLAAASLLGAVSEGAWFAAGERLRDQSPRLAKALDLERSNVSAVQERVEELLRGAKATDPGTLGELRAAAGLLRDLRNYGVHPRDRETRSIEDVFTEAACGALLLSTRRYLVQLAAAVASALPAP